MQKPPSLTFVGLTAGALLFTVQFPQGWLRGADDAPAATPAAAAPAAPAPAAPVPSEEAVKLLKEARQRLFSYNSVRASIRQFVALGEHRFEAEGSYTAGPFNPLPQLRLEYQVRVGNTIGTLLEVCDGQILHTQRSLQRIDAAKAEGEAEKPEITVTRRDVRAILDAVNKHGATPETILQAELGLGGLPALLTSIERVMTFTSVKQEPLGGRPCHLLQGNWKPEFLEQLQQQFQVFGRSVQSYLPETIRIHLDAETLFPVRIAYWPPPAPEGPARPPLLTLEFTDIHLNEPVNAMVFDFVSTGADETDITKEFIQAIQAAAATAAPATPAAPPATPPAS
jgi:hypothetical protein